MKRLVRKSAYSGNLATYLSGMGHTIDNFDFLLQNGVYGQYTQDLVTDFQEVFDNYCNIMNSIEMQGYESKGGNTTELDQAYDLLMQLKNGLDQGQFSQGTWDSFKQNVTQAVRTVGAFEPTMTQ